MPRNEYFSPVRVATFVVAVAVALTLALTPVDPKQEFPDLGAAADLPIVARERIAYESALLTAEARDAAADAVAPSVTFDAGVRTAQVAALDNYFRQVDAIREDDSLSANERADRLAGIRNQPANPRVQVLIRGFSDEQWVDVKERAITLLTDALSNNVEEREAEALAADIRNDVLPGLSSLQSEAVTELAAAFIRPNVLEDAQATAAARENARNAVEPVVHVVERGDPVVEAGERVDALTAETLAQMQPEGGSVPGDDLVAMLLLAVGSAGVLGAYLFVAKPDGAASDRRLLLLGVLTVIAVAAARVYLPIVLPDGRDEALDLMIPLAAAPILVAVLLNTTLGVMVAVIVGVLAGVAAMVHPSYVDVPDGVQAIRPLGVFLFASLAGVFASVRAERLTQYGATGIIAGMAGFAASMAFWLLDPMRETQALPWLALAAAIAGVATSILVIGAFSVLGMTFGITTRLQLLELAQLTQPLLRRLQEEAPGTFHHSLLVATMAERAATEIHADPLMVRVGAYYHDIGKLAKPHMYIENQSEGQNPHESLDPAESAQVIMDHVRWGRELARRERLPARVRAVIPEHHGTRLVTYFYRKAAMENPDIDPHLFRYEGPRPQTRETAIVMLADSCEAVVRSSPERDEATIDRLVDGVIEERLHERQFDECDITMRDLRSIARSFKVTLRGVYHPRIEYPAPTEAERRAAGRAIPSAPRGDQPVDGTALPAQDRGR